MSGPTPTLSLPRDVFELMTVEVIWEAFQGFDGHVEPSYAAPVSLICWQEAHGVSGGAGGMEVFRHADGTVVEPRWDLYFDGDNSDVRSFQLYDRFTPSGVTSDSEQRLQAVMVNTLYGPNFDNTNPWLVLVTL